MKSILLLFFMLFSLSLSAQTPPDSVQFWGYTVDMTDKGYSSDSVQAMGSIRLFRMVGLESKLHKKTYGKNWNPGLSFSIYSIKHQDFVTRYAKHVKAISSCGYSEQGGDVIVVGNLILFNHSVCVNCAGEDFKDYCRPMIQYILSQVDSSRVNSVDDLLTQLIVKKVLSGEQ